MINAIFKPLDTEVYTNPAKQWDYGQILRIQGVTLPKAVEVHFGISGEENTVPSVGVTDGDHTDIEIPDGLLRQPNDLVAYVYIADVEKGNTVKTINIPVIARAKPAIPHTPEDEAVFREAIEAVNTAADRAEKAGQTATEAAGQAAEDAQQTAEDRKEVEKMVETVSDISEQVKKVEQLSRQAQDAATKAGKSEQAADGFKTQAESAKKDAEAAAVKTAEDKTAVENAKTEVLEVKTEVNADRTVVEQIKNEVEQLGGSIAGAVQSGVQEITQAGTAQKTAVEGAGTQAVNSVENAQQTATEAVGEAKTTAVQAVQAEGAKQTGNVTTEGTKQVKAVQDKGNEVLQSIPEDFTTQMETKLNKQQGIENKGKALVIGEDGNVAPGEVRSGGGDGIAIINTMSGESPLVIPDSAERVNKRLELGGKTEQAQTSGKNLFDPNNNYEDLVWIRNNGEIVGGSNARTSDYIPVEQGNYAFQFDVINYNQMFVAGYNTGKQFVKIVGTISKGKCIIKIDDIQIETIRLSYTRESTRIQLERSETQTPYEPYTGGKPSPSPEYPQEIKNSGKWTEEKQKYEIDVKVTGRNLFNGKLLKGKFITDDMNVVSDLVTMNTFDKPVEIEPNTDYVISANGVIWEGNINVYDENGKKIVQHFTGKFKTPSNAKYIRASISNARAPIDSKIQMEYGTAMNEFEQYHQPQVLTLTSDRPITKWDRLVEQGGEIGWLYQSASDTDVKPSRLDLFPYGFSLFKDFGNGVYVYKVVNIKKAIGFQTSLCEQFKNKDGSYSTGDLFCYSDQPSIQMQYFVTDIPTLEEFKTWMETNPLTMVYQTVESQFVPLQQSEQNAIRALKTYYPTTVITADGGELDPDIKVTYTADTKNYIDNKVSAKVASIIRQYRLNTANLLSLMPMETQAAMIENDTNNILNNLESEETHE